MRRRDRKRLRLRHWAVGFGAISVGFPVYVVVRFVRDWGFAIGLPIAAVVVWLTVLYMGAVVRDNKRRNGNLDGHPWND